MPRNKRKKEKNKNKQIPENRQVKVETLQHQSEESMFPLEQYSLDKLANFLKADERIVAIAYKVPTSTIASEEIVNTYRLKMMEAINKAARNRGAIPDPGKVIIKALPLGEEAIIKAYYKLSDAIEGRKAPANKKDPNLPKTIPNEGLFVLEE